MINPAAYDAALRQLGRPTVLFTAEAIAAWRAEPRTTRDGHPRYSALAIATTLTLTLTLTLRAVFRLALCQTKGLIGSTFTLLGINLAVLHNSTLSRRTETLALPRLKPCHSTRSIRLLLDSAGMKLCGAGEWIAGFCCKPREGVEGYKLVEGWA